MIKQYTPEELEHALTQYFQLIQVGAIEFAAQQLANVTNQVVQVHVTLLKTEMTVTVGPVDETKLQ